MADRKKYRAIQRFKNGGDAEKLRFINCLVSGDIGDFEVTKPDLIDIIEWAAGKISLDEDDGK